jgi:dGTP triphosphohydrolase
MIDYKADFVGPAKSLQEKLQDVIFDKIINTPCVQTLEHRGQLNLLAMFRAIETDPEKLLG